MSQTQTQQTAQVTQANRRYMNTSLAEALKSTGLQAAIEEKAKQVQAVDTYYKEKCMGSKPTISDMKAFCDHHGLEVTGHSGHFKSYDSVVKAWLNSLLMVEQSNRRIIGRVKSGTPGKYALNGDNGSTAIVSIYETKRVIQGEEVTLKMCTVAKLTGSWKNEHGCMMKKPPEKIIFPVSMIEKRDELDDLASKYKAAIIGKFLSGVLDPLIKKYALEVPAKQPNTNH